MTTAEVERYLSVLGVPRRTPSLEALAELTAAHVTRVPFENVSKLLRFRRSGFRGIPDLATFLGDIERFHLGGTCYTNNVHFGRLLAALGYDVALCGADMSKPDVHVVNVVRLDGHEYLVDGGFAAPFLEPLPLGLDRDQEIALGGERYVLKPRGADGRSRLDHHRDGRPPHGYTLNPRPRRVEEFAGVIDESFEPEATFMNALTIVRFLPGRSLALRNLKLVEAEGDRTRTVRFADAAPLPVLIEERFGIPRALTAEVLAGLTLVDY